MGRLPSLGQCALACRRVRHSAATCGTAKSTCLPLGVENSDNLRREPQCAHMPFAGAKSGRPPFRGPLALRVVGNKVSTSPMVG